MDGEWIIKQGESLQAIQALDPKPWSILTRLPVWIILIKLKSLKGQGHPCMGQMPQAVLLTLSRKKGLKKHQEV